MTLKSYFLVSAVMASWLLVITGTYGFSADYKLPAFMDLFDDHYEDESAEISNLNERSINTSDAVLENLTSGPSILLAKEKVPPKVEPKTLELDTITKVQTEKKANVVEEKVPPKVEPKTLELDTITKVQAEKKANVVEEKVPPKVEPKTLELDTITKVQADKKANVVVNETKVKEQPQPKLTSKKKKSILEEMTITEKADENVISRNASPLLQPPQNFADLDTKANSDSLVNEANTDKIFDIKSAAEDGIRFTKLCIRLIASLVENVIAAYMSVGEAPSNSPQKTASDNDYDQSPSRKIVKRDLSPSGPALDSAASLSKIEETSSNSDDKQKTDTDLAEKSADHQTLHEKPAEKSADHQTLPEKPDEKSSDHQTLLEKPAEKSADHQTLPEKPAEKSADHQTLPEKPAEKNADHQTLHEKNAESKLEAATNAPVLPSTMVTTGNAVEKVKAQKFETLEKQSASIIQQVGELLKQEKEENSSSHLVEAFGKLNDESNNIPDLFKNDFERFFGQQGIDADNDSNKKTDLLPASFGTIALVVGVVWAIGVVVAAGVVAASYKFGLFNLNRFNAGRGNANPPAQRSSVA